MMSEEASSLASPSVSSKILGLKLLTKAPGPSRTALHGFW
jgi:hypothetical protein